MSRTGFTIGSISVSHCGMMSMLQRIIPNYEARRLEETGELAGLSEEGRAWAMHIATSTNTLSTIDDSIDPGESDGTDIRESVAMGRWEWRRRDHRETEQILTNILSGEAELCNRSHDGTSPETITSGIPSASPSALEQGKFTVYRHTMRSEVRKEPPHDIEFPYFEVTYYDQPASAGITIKTTDARSERWPDSSQSFHNDGSISGLKPSNEDTQHQWRQKLGELLTGGFLLVDEHLSGMICTILFFASLIKIIPPQFAFSQRGAGDAF